MTADEVFQDQCFLWEREASIGSDFITFKIMEAQTKKARYVSFKLDSGCSVRFIIHFYSSVIQDLLFSAQ